MADLKADLAPASDSIVTMAPNLAPGHWPVYVVWSAIVCYGVVLYGTVGYGTIWYSILFYSMVWYSLVWYSRVLYGTVYMVWYGMVWYGMVQYGMIWYGVVGHVTVWFCISPFGIWPKSTLTLHTFHKVVFTHNLNKNYEKKNSALKT